MAKNIISCAFDLTKINGSPKFSIYVDPFITISPKKNNFTYNVKLTYEFYSFSDAENFLFTKILKISFTSKEKIFKTGTKNETLLFMGEKKNASETPKKIKKNELSELVFKSFKRPIIIRDSMKKISCHHNTVSIELKKLNLEQYIKELYEYVVKLSDEETGSILKKYIKKKRKTTKQKLQEQQIAERELSLNTDLPFVSNNCELLKIPNKMILPMSTNNFIHSDAFKCICEKYKSKELPPEIRKEDVFIVDFVQDRCADEAKTMRLTCKTCGNY